MTASNAQLSAPSLSPVEDAQHVLTEHLVELFAWCDAHDLLLVDVLETAERLFLERLDAADRTPRGRS
jgi:hypothetical protein